MILISQCLFSEFLEHFLLFFLQLQNLISQYIDVQEIKKSEPVVENGDKALLEQYDINSYFVRKKQLRLVFSHN
jgi:hypothetical protein